jgi:hypothetical protein
MGDWERGSHGAGEFLTQYLFDQANIDGLTGAAVTNAGAGWRFRRSVLPTDSDSGGRQ